MRMFSALPRVRKLTAPPDVALTLMVKNTTSPSRNTHAQTLLTARSRRRLGSTRIDAGAISPMSMSVTIGTLS